MSRARPRHVTFPRETARPGPYRGIFSEMMRYLAWAYLKVGGWQLHGDWPDEPKMVLIAAPHTSNWDGINMLAAAAYYRVKLSWMGKQSLTQGPFGWLLVWLGCVPIDRASKNDVVQQMRAAFETADGLVLAVPPEGSRSKVASWKTGYYHIAHTADVPIVMSVLDYGAKTVGLSGLVRTCGDYEADYELIRPHYERAKGRYPDKFTLDGPSDQNRSPL